MVIFSIKNRGTVATGRVLHGQITTGSPAIICLDSGRKIHSRVVAIEAFRKILTCANEGDNVGLLLEGVNRDELHQGCYINGVEDPTNIHNTDSYYDKNVFDPYKEMFNRSETMIDGKPVSQLNEKPPKTFWQKLFKK